MSTWVVYSRESCSLCETFIRELADLLGPRADHVQLVDVGSSDELESRYGSKVPVLTINDDIVCMYRLNVERVRAHLSG